MNFLRPFRKSAPIVNHMSLKRTYEVCSQILTPVVQSIIYQRSNYALPGEAHFPYTRYVHHMFRVLVIDDMPLFSK